MTQIMFILSLSKIDYIPAVANEGTCFTLSMQRLFKTELETWVFQAYSKLSLELIYTLYGWNL